MYIQYTGLADMSTLHVSVSVSVLPTASQTGLHLFPSLPDQWAQLSHLDDDCPVVGVHPVIILYLVSTVRIHFLWLA